MMLSPSSIRFSGAARDRPLADGILAHTALERASPTACGRAGGTMHLQDLAALRHQAQVAADGLGRDTQPIARSLTETDMRSCSL